MSYSEVLVHKKYLVHKGDFILRVLDYTVTISFGCIWYSVCFNLFCNVWMCVCVGFVMCGCFGSTCTCIYCFVFLVLCLVLFLLYITYLLHRVESFLKS